MKGPPSLPISIEYQILSEYYIKIGTAGYSSLVQHLI